MARRRKAEQLPFHRNAEGTFTVGLEPEARTFLADLPRQLLALVESGDADSLRRLFPPAYHRPGDAERDEDYQRLMREDLLESHRRSLDLLTETAHAEHLTFDQLMGWMHAVNDIRLVLGTQLDVYEGLDVDDLPDEDPRVPALSVYGWLSGVLELIVLSVSGQLPHVDSSDADALTDEQD